MFATSTLIKIALILDEEEQEDMKKHCRKRKRRFWVHKMLKKRKEEGEFATLHTELVDDQMKFFKYYRMSLDEFNNLLGHIGELIQKQNTTFRESISPIQKTRSLLELTNHCLSGKNFRNMMRLLMIEIMRHLKMDELASTLLKFLATGDSFQTIAFSYRLGHSTVHAIVQEVCNAIVTKSNVIMQEESPSVGNNECILRNLPGQGGNAQQEAFNTREIFTRFFNSESGSVPWQYEKIEMT
ncbi:hypothetical protein NQ318_015436 [Aromia moschata]|uniref:Uncharacterized protein n=1 Tax=Aromia moschata TaxID=1265417 RepID=A0AAV8YT01_9CUCU|nr:hypothetical protein NQ318_015436 [Aromia moschata]